MYLFLNLLNFNRGMLCVTSFKLSKLGRVAVIAEGTGKCHNFH